MGQVDLGHFHGVRFYESAESLARVVAAFIGSGIVAGQNALVIARPEHRAAIAETLESLSFSMEGLRCNGRLTMVDAGATLASCMINGLPDAVRFESVVGAAIHACAGANPRGLRAYDEMSDVLTQDDRLDAATRVETLWNRLLPVHGSALLCGHSVNGRLHMNWRKSVCAWHTHVVAEDGMPHAVRSDSGTDAFDDR
jgi:hypothetical protein